MSTRAYSMNCPESSPGEIRKLDDYEHHADEDSDNEGVADEGGVESSETGATDASA